MEVDFLGAEQNLSVLVGSQAEYDLRFFDYAGEAIDLSNVTFDGVVTFPDEHTEEIDITQNATETNALHVVFPLLSEVNSYVYEIRSVGDEGDRVRIAFGKIGVLPTSLLLEPDVYEETERKRLDVKLPGKARAHVMMVWQASTRAAAAAEEARIHSIESREQADAAKEAAKEAKASADAAQETLDSAKQVVADAVKGATDEAKGYAADAKKSAEEAKAAKEGVQAAVDKVVKDAEEDVRKLKDEAAQSAEDAKQAVKDVQASAKQLATEATQDVRDQLGELMNKTEKTRKSADATVEKLNGFLAKFDDNVRSVVWIDPENDHLIIGGTDTGCKVSGDPGKSPYVDGNGDWQYWDDESAQWRNGGPARGEDGFSPYIDAEWHLVYRDPLTGQVQRSLQPIKGKDGLDARQVRRIIVQSAEEIPQEGETCNGGYYYYVPLKDAPPVAIFTPSETRTASGKIEVNGKVMRLPDPELPANEAALELAENLRAVYPDAIVEVDPEANAVVLIGDELFWAVKGLPKEDWQLTLHVRMKREGYDVYAWLEDPNGEASWVHVGEANDLATAEVYGLTKLGTDALVQDGAPVGTDETGNMRVPAADIAQRGTVRLSLNGQMEPDGGGIGVDDTGRIWTRTATRTEYGVVKTSYTGSTEMVPVVGQNEVGQLMVPYAGLNQPGVVRLGSYGGQANPIPYILSVGVDDNHRLANNLVYGGALQHINPQGWIARNMPWLDASKEAHPEYFQDLYYLGIVTSEQFTQTPEQGIILNSASTTLKAGVFIARGIGTDEREDAVPTADTVWTWANGRFYTKTEIDSEVSRLENRIDDVKSTLSTRIDKEVKTLNDAIAAQSKTLNTRIDTEVKTLNTRIDNEVKTLNKTVTDKEKGLSDRINTLNTRVTDEVKKLNTSITNKEKALSDRITANANKFSQYTNTEGMKQYVKNTLASYPTQSAMTEALKKYYTKTESDARFMRGEDGIMRMGIYTSGEDIVTLSKKNPDKLYIKTQKKQ